MCLQKLVIVIQDLKISLTLKAHWMTLFSLNRALKVLHSANQNLKVVMIWLSRSTTLTHQAQTRSPSARSRDRIVMGAGGRTQVVPLGVHQVLVSVFQIRNH